MNINDLVFYLNTMLTPEKFKDYCPNGLQVQGRPTINKIVTGVTASMALLEAAKSENADLILVHHGYFWRGEMPEIVGIKQKRIKFLLENDLNLLAYHLPLDAHDQFGNNVQLGKLLNFNLTKWAGENNILAVGSLKQPQTLAELGQAIAIGLQREPQVIGNLAKAIKSVAWCTGAAQGYMEQAIANGVDVFISGEISEQTVHLALESGVAYIAAGHHATEKYGVQALGGHLAQKFGINHVFINIDNPV
ncbi:MAG: Nif3-like dinuclear metal center hexameric protein [Methylophilaceae bacterium]|nr:Nif3-like dinuclear metal center hexameric protein [Methylophilaceae bacterium]